MATSGSVNFNESATEIISSAYELARVKDPIEDLTNDQYRRALSSVNKIIKYLQKNGMPLWAIKNDTITLTQSTQSYSCGPAGTGLTERPLRILQAFYRSGSNDTQMELISREQYYMLGDKSIEGIPHQLYYDPQLSLGNIYIYNPADANTAGNSIYLIYQRPFEDIDDLTNDFDFPQEWLMCIEYMLAVDIALRNGVRQGRISQLESKAKDYYYECLWWDVEPTTLQFQPDFSGHAY